MLEGVSALFVEEVSLLEDVELFQVALNVEEEEVGEVHAREDQDGWMGLQQMKGLITLLKESTLLTM